jgi:hypothetical protein
LIRSTSLFSFLNRVFISINSFSISKFNECLLRLKLKNFQSLYTIYRAQRPFRSLTTFKIMFQQSSSFLVKSSRPNKYLMGVAKMQSIFNKGHASCLKDEKLRVFRNLSKYNKNHLNKIIPRLNV